MCSVCLSIPCNPRCPNAADSVPVFVCKICGGGIFEGDKYFDEGSSMICGECMNDMSAEEILELFDEKMKTA